MEPLTPIERRTLMLIADQSPDFRPHLLGAWEYRATCTYFALSSSLGLSRAGLKNVLASLRRKGHLTWRRVGQGCEYVVAAKVPAG